MNPARLRELLSTPLDDHAELAEALALLRVSPAMERARDEMSRWADQARAELAALPAGPATDALDALCDAVVTRTA